MELKLELSREFYSEQGSATLKGLRLDYTLCAKNYAGIVIPFADASPDNLAENFMLEFEIRGTPIQSRFECKLVTCDGTGVWWVLLPDFEIKDTWSKSCFKRRHFVYAWGPSQDFLSGAKQLELVITAKEGSGGFFEVRNLKLSSLPVVNIFGAEVVVSSGKARGLLESHDQFWESDEREAQSLEIDFHETAELGGIIFNWGENFAKDFDLEVEDSQGGWNTLERVRGFFGGSSFHYLPDTEARRLRLVLLKRGAGESYQLDSVELQGSSFSSSWNSFLSACAQRKRRGLYPRYFLKEQSYWTVVAWDGSRQKALINEEGMIELGYGLPSIEPFVKFGNELSSWNESEGTQSLVKDCLPMPVVTRVYPGIKLSILAWMNQSEHTYVSYEIENSSNKTQIGELLLLVRPYQVNPPWQFLNIPGGFCPVKSLEFDGDELVINNSSVLRGFEAAKRLGAGEGDVVEQLEHQGFPASTWTKDPRGFCSAVYEYAFVLKPGEKRKWSLACAPSGEQVVDPEASYAETEQYWETLLSRILFTINSDLENTVKAQLAYILVNRSGPAIQPGTRCYRRTWIRDAAMTCSALLKFGFFEQVKDFIEWFAPYVARDGAVPCVVDSRGPDDTPEHDSHGEFLFLVSEYCRYTKDTELAKSLLPKLFAVARHIERLSVESKGSGVAPHLAGLLPKSISHEGYSSCPAYSYWDDLWAVRGLEGLALLCHELDIDSAEADRISIGFRVTVIESIERAMALHEISFIPGAADLGDFDPTSTTIGADPCTLLWSEKKPELEATFELYWHDFEMREKDFSGAYTPYELRVVGTFIRLGQIERAWRALDFFLAHRRPQGWRNWAEVVFADSRHPGFVGDIPHGWVGSDFLRSVCSLVLYEENGVYHLGKGILPEQWEKGVCCELYTPDGKLRIDGTRQTFAKAGTAYYNHINTQNRGS